MKKAILSKLKNLVRGDDGAALVITLGVFFFMYIFCAGVYAIGFAVKEKIHLQNACDAAAYSAAIVQADTFSRIATINRTMGWTYAQMTRRQADYIMWKWLDGVQRHYGESVTQATSHGGGGLHGHVHWYVGPDEPPDPDVDSSLSMGLRLGDKDSVRLNRGTIARVRTGSSSIVAHLGRFVGDHFSETAPSFYAKPLPRPGDIERLRRQLSKDRRNIVRMNNSLSALLRDLPSRIRDAVTGTLHANVPSYMRSQCCVSIEDSSDPERDYIAPMTDESVFVTGGGERMDSMPGWLPKSKDIIQRCYAQQSSSLVARWNWASYQWYCGEHFNCHCRRTNPRRCVYSGRDAQGEDRALDGLTPSYFVGVEAKPLRIDRRYFGTNGTITVALARRSANPFASILGTQAKGLYSAFNPLGVTWTFCLASAKAGYKLRRGQDDWEIRYNGRAVDYHDNRDYCIDWKPTRRLRYEWKRPSYENGRLVKGHWDYENDVWRQGWNLIQPDWDAVMLPVRQGGTRAAEKWYTQGVPSLRQWALVSGTRKLHFEPIWENDSRNTRFVEQVANAWEWSSLSGARMSAANSPNAILTAGPTYGDVGDTLDGKLAGDLWLNHWYRGAATPTASGTSKWNIENPGARLDWNRIGDEMYH